MKTSVDDPLLKSVQLADFYEYLRQNGWRQIDHPNGKAVMFEGIPGDDGSPLELMLPRSTGFQDYWQRLADAINALSEVEQRSPQDVTRSIVYFNFDILKVRILDTDGRGSIALKLAADQIRALKKLILYGACSEYDPRPYFPTQLRSAATVSDYYQFGHTFPGSFGFTIIAPVRPPTEFHVQVPLSEELGKPVVLSPVERRVLERIARGLAFTLQATSQQDYSILLSQYASGFNSNMCDAIVTMSQGKKVAIEYDLDWSAKLPPTEDVVQADVFRLSSPSYENLAFVSRELKHFRPPHERVRGIVKGLTSKGAPLGLTSERTVVIRWSNRPDGRPVDLIVTLDRDDYLEAYRAHLDYTTIEVTGIPHRIANVWRLSEPTDFDVLKRN